MIVKWGNSKSDAFTVSNGVRQGGILSPYLFSLYFNEMSIRLNGMNVGCSVGGVRINHLLYADDLVLISPSSKGLQVLLDCCGSFANDFNVQFNPNKSHLMIVRTKDKLLGIWGTLFVQTSQMIWTY